MLFFRVQNCLERKKEKSNKLSHHDFYYSLNLNTNAKKITNYSYTLFN